MKIAGDLCIYTNHHTVLEVIDTVNEETIKPKIGYWNVRGKGAQIKHILAYVGVDYDLKEYSCGEAPEYSRSEWLDDKFNQGLDFPNLPYFDDGQGFKLTESKAIMKFIA